VYCRISQDPGDGRVGVERQRKDGLADAEREGWTLVSDISGDTFTDNDISGDQGYTKRAAFARMMAAVKAGRVDVVIAYSQARLVRDVRMFLDTLDVFSAHAVTFRNLTGQDVVPGESRTMPTIQAAMDEEYKRKIAEDVRRAKREIAENGQWLGGRRPYGYTVHKPSPKTPSVLIKDKTEADRIVSWAKDFLGGRSLNSIADELTAEGVPTSMGGRWTAQTLRQILTNRVYLADAPAQWEDILDAETFNAVGAILADPNRRPKKIGARYPLVGVLYCGALQLDGTACGARMKSRPTNKGGRSIRRYGCREHGTINADQAEAQVFDTVARKADLPRVGEIIRDAEGHEDEEAQALRVANAVDAGKLASLADLVADGTLTPDAVRKAAAPLKNAIASREAQLAERAGRSALDRFAGRVVADWAKLDVEDQRAVLLSLVRRVVVGPKVAGHGWHPERLTPVWRFSALAAIKWPEPTEADEAEQERLSDEYRDGEDLAQLRADNAEADAETSAAGMVSTL